MSTTFPADPVESLAAPPPLLLLVPPHALSAATERTARPPASALLRACLIQLPLCRFRASRRSVRPNVIAVPRPRQANALRPNATPTARVPKSKKQSVSAPVIYPLASDQHVMRAGERHQPQLREAKPPPRTGHRHRAHGQPLAESEHGHRSAALTAILLRHSCGRLQNRQLQRVSTSHQVLALHSQTLSLLACGGSLALEFLRLRVER